MRFFQKKIIIVSMNAVLTMMAAFTFSGCTFVSKVKFMKQISSMSDQNLVCYYHGINERIKDIGNVVKIKTRSDYTEHDLSVSQEPFIFGGEAYKLNRKRLMILEELEKRNISPH